MGSLLQPTTGVLTTVLREERRLLEISDSPLGSSWEKILLWVAGSRYLLTELGVLGVGSLGLHVHSRIREGEGRVRQGYGRDLGLGLPRTSLG